MNIFKRFYCRTYQGIMRLLLPILPYREPEILDSNEALVLELKKRNYTNVLLVTDTGLSKLGLMNNLVDVLKDNNINVHIYDGTVANPTTDNVSEAERVYHDNNCEAIIAFGGGSPMDCAKATGARVARPKKPTNKMKGVMKVLKKLPLLIAIPTTAGTGSETTLAAVITDSKTRHKYAINDFPLIPSYAMLDANLTIGLPPHITSTTGMDALTHAIEAYIGRSTTKYTRECALNAIKLIFDNLERAYTNGNDIDARQNMLKASYLAGVAFTRSYVGYVHAVAHSLGGKYNIAHGLANAVLLPIVLKKYGKAIYKKLYQIGVFTCLFDEKTPIEVGAKIFIEKIEAMNANMNIPNKLSGIKTEDISYLAQTAEREANPLYPVPKLFTSQQLEDIYYEVKDE